MYNIPILIYIFVVIYIIQRFFNNNNMYNSTIVSIFKME